MERNLNAYMCILLVLLFSCSVVSDSCDPMEHNAPGFPVIHGLLELAQTDVHRVGDAFQPSHPLSSPLVKVSLFSVSVSYLFRIHYFLIECLDLMFYGFSLQKV